LYSLCMYNLGLHFCMVGVSFKLEFLYWTFLLCDRYTIVLYLLLLFVCLLLTVYCIPLV
jgi:hypothetical protein